MPTPDASIRSLSWVPPYFISQVETALQTDFGGIGMKDGLSHLALQFWSPHSGKAQLTSKYGSITSHDIGWFRDWGATHGVRVLLCVFNGENGWNWSAAVNSFKTHRTAFVRSLVEQVQHGGLDGVEIDFEGPDIDNRDKSAFLAFLDELRFRLPAEKTISVASFAYLWHAPNSTWWNAMLPFVNAITSMGYEQVGRRRTSSKWNSYHAQKQLIDDPARLLLGMPAYQEFWKGHSATEHLQWIVEDGETGVALWDASLSNQGTPTPAWRSPEIWQQLATLRTAPPGPGL